MGLRCWRRPRRARRAMAASPPRQRYVLSCLDQLLRQAVRDGTTPGDFLGEAARLVERRALGRHRGVRFQGSRPETLTFCLHIRPEPLVSSAPAWATSPVPKAYLRGNLCTATSTSLALTRPFSTEKGSRWPI